VPSGERFKPIACGSLGLTRARNAGRPSGDRTGQRHAEQPSGDGSPVPALLAIASVTEHARVPPASRRILDYERHRS
jgi:hypothetical protein